MDSCHQEDTLPQVVRVDKFLNGCSEYAASANGNQPTHLASRPGDLPVLFIVLCFNGRLALSYTPQVPPEHDQNRESDHGRQRKLCDVDKLGCIVVPGSLKSLMRLSE